MPEPERIVPQVAYKKAKLGTALLVCAYEDDALCKNMHLQGGILLSEFIARLPALHKEQEIIFYCN